MSRIRGGPLVRRLEILKLLQGNPMRTADIGDYFRSEDAETVDPRTIQRDLRAPQDGFEFLGTTLKITEETRGHSLKYYKSTVHPLFLALNLTELTALLKALQWGCRDSDQQVRETYRHLLNYVYRQLTDYAKGGYGTSWMWKFPKCLLKTAPKRISTGRTFFICSKAAGR